MRSSCSCRGPRGRRGERVPTIELTLEETGPGRRPCGPCGRGGACPARPARAAGAAAAAEPAARPRPPEPSPPAATDDGAAVVTAPAAPAHDPAEPPEPSPGCRGRLPDAAGGSPGQPEWSGGRHRHRHRRRSGRAIRRRRGERGGRDRGRTGDAAAAGLTPPRPRTQISPAYPRSARAARCARHRQDRGAHRRHGCRLSAEVSRSSGTASLDRAALDEVRHTTFQPAVQRGSPVPCRLIIPVRFALK